MAKKIKFKSVSGAIGKRISGWNGSIKLSRSLKTTAGKKVDSFHLSSYTGQPVRVGNFIDPVIVDLKGTRFAREVTPIIADHNPSLRIGHTSAQTVVLAGQQSQLGTRKIKGPSIAVDAQRSSDMKIAKGFIADARNGFPFQASIGADIEKAYFVDEDETVRVNGKVWDGPIVVAAKTVIREISVTVLGADGDTQALVAARKSENDPMKFEAWLKSMGLKLAELSPIQLKKLRAKHRQEFLEPDADDVPPKKTKVELTDPDEDDDEEDEDDSPAPKKRLKMTKPKDDDQDDINARRLRLADESDRVDTINSVANKFPAEMEIKLGTGKKATTLTLQQFKKHAIQKGMSANEFELELRRADYPEDPGTPAIHMVAKDLNGEAIACSILRSAGTIPSREKNEKTGREYGLECMFSDEVLELSERRQHNIGLSLNNLLRLQIASTGGYANHLYNEDLWIAAHASWTKAQGANRLQASGFSTISVTNILENVAHKAALSSFEGVESIWRFICGRRPLTDFKAHSLYRLDWNGSYKKVAADGTLKHVSMTDTKKTIQAETYGAMITIDRKTQVNDDLGMIVEKGRGLGTLGGQRIEESVFVTLLSNPSSFFHASNGNLITGGGTALSIASVSQAKQAFVDQVINGKPVSVSPRIMLVGSALWETANRIYTQSQMALTTTADTPKFDNNPHVGLYRPYMSPYLNNTGILDQDGAAISGQSATQWYLFGPSQAPQGSALVIGFLNGREVPYFDSEATEFSVPGGIQMRSYHDWGVAMHITQMALKSAGA